MRKRSKSRLTDPVWYRIRYALAAQRLHAASVPPGDARGKGLSEAMCRLARRKTRAREVQDPPGDLDAAAALEARELLQETARVLAFSGWRWIGCRPSHLTLAWAWLRRFRRPRADRRLARFLDSVVEPTAVVLFWSARIDMGQTPRRALEATADGPPGAPERPLDRDGHTASEDWLEAYLTHLLRSLKQGPLPWHRRFLAALGFKRYAKSRPPAYRVNYNLACLLARALGRAPERGIWSDADLIAWSLEFLKRSLAQLGGERRRAVAAWAWRDPALAPLRKSASDRFTEIAGPERHAGT